MGQCDFNASIKSPQNNNNILNREKHLNENININNLQAKKGMIDLMGDKYIINKADIKVENKEVINVPNKLIKNVIKTDPVIIQRPISKLEPSRAKTPIIALPNNNNNNNNLIKREVVNKIVNPPNQNGVKIINKNIVQSNNQKIIQRPISSRPQSSKVPSIGNNNYKDNVAIAKKIISERNASPIRYNNQINNKSPLVKKPSSNNSPKNILSRPQSGRELKGNNVINNNDNNQRKIIEKINYDRNNNINRLNDNKIIKPNYHFKPSNDKIIIANNNKAGYLDAIKVISDNRAYVNNGPKIAIINQKYKR